ncbi:LD-carboxypeptidase [Streptomyces sp. NPDC087270]|uniref:LD-carboxypeptidase n=1 Tax=Streptomyces sp. NPDC087270 TaxID=3365774 RepID=UPI003821C958
MRSTGCADRRSWRYATPEERAADLHAAFADPDIKAAISSIGGVWRRDGSGLFPGAARWPVARAALPRNFAWEVLPRALLWPLALVVRRLPSHGCRLNRAEDVHHQGRGELRDQPTTGRQVREPSG